MSAQSEKYDVVVGIPSYNEAETIGHVAETAGRGLERYFPGLRCIVVNCDNRSPDGTKEAFLAAPFPKGVDRKYIATPEGVRGKGNNSWNLFRFCEKAEARAIVVVDADLRSITPEWIKYLGCPVLQEGYDFVAPFYSRHQFDGTITNHLCYPLVFSLTGYEIRQPIGGDFAFSPKLCSHWISLPWNDMVRQYGIDIFMSLNAVFGDFKICEAGLGSKIHKASSPKLGKMFEEVVYSLFSTVLNHRATWLEKWLHRGAETIYHMKTQSMNRTGMKKLQEPQWLNIDILKLKRDCRNEYDQYKDLVRKYLTPYAYRQLDAMFRMDSYVVDIMLWSQVVYTLLYMFDEAAESSKQEIINVLKPLYFARTLAFDYKTWRYSVNFAEEEVHKQAMAFLSQKPYLFGLYLGEGKCTFQER
jgi:glycosyltransferase involved in cell wall biosynthesis